MERRPPWLSDRPSPAVLVTLEDLDPEGKAVLVRVGEDEALAVWLREDA
jgi:hypothetical protein